MVHSLCSMLLQLSSPRMQSKGFCRQVLAAQWYGYVITSRLTIKYGYITCTWPSLVPRPLSCIEKIGEPGDKAILGHAFHASTSSGLVTCTHALSHYF